jgi:hypothetical protein
MNVYVVQEAGYWYPASSPLRGFGRNSNLKFEYGRCGIIVIGNKLHLNNFYDVRWAKCYISLINLSVTDTDTDTSPFSTAGVVLNNHTYAYTHIFMLK